MKLLFHSQQLWLVTAGEDGLVVVWDLVSKAKAATLKVAAVCVDIAAVCVDIAHTQDLQPCLAVPIVMNF